jgi:quinolinate synthase
VKIVSSFPAEKPIVFAPDKNLGAYVNKITGRNMVLWNGTCEVHDIINTENIIRLKIENPDAKLIAHPECKAVILEMADFIGSTTALLNFTRTDGSLKYIVATETGIIHQMKKSSPDKQFLIVPTDSACSCNDCPYMKMNTLEKLFTCLEFETNEIILEPDIIERARKPIIRMLDLSA